MRWFVEVSALGKPDVQKYCVEAESWQRALQGARGQRGEDGPMSGFSIELIEDGYRAVDPLARTRFVVRRAPDDTPLTSSAPPPTISSAPAPGSGSNGAASSAPATEKAFKGNGAAGSKDARAKGGAEDPRASTKKDDAPPTKKAPDEAITRPSRRPPRPGASTPPPPNVKAEPDADPPTERALNTPPPVGSKVEGLPETKVVLTREQDPTDGSPLTYREYAFAVPEGTSEETCVAVLHAQLRIVEAHLTGAKMGKLVNLAVFDVVWSGKPPRPPIAALTWKDWKGAPTLSFPQRGAGASNPPRPPSRMPASMQAAADARAVAVAIPPPPGVGTLAVESEERRAADGDVPMSRPPTTERLPEAPAKPPTQQSAPPPQQHSAPPPQQHSAPPPQHSAPPPQQHSAPPPQQHSAPPQQHSAPPPQHSAPPPQHSAPPPQQHSAPPPQHSAPPPQQHSAPPPQQHSAPPPQQHSAPPPQQHSAPPPQQHHSAPPPQQHSAPPLVAERLDFEPPPGMPDTKRTSTPDAAMVRTPSGRFVRGRVSGDELITALFESMHDLHFLRDALDGGQFCLALATEVLPARAALIHFFDLEKREWVVACARGKGTQALLTTRSSEGDEVLRQAARKRRALVVPHAASAVQDRYRHVDGAKSLIAAPIMQAGRALGAIEIINPLDGMPFTEDEGNAMTYIAEQFAEYLGSRGIVVDRERITAAAAR